MKVADLAVREPVTVRPDATLEEAAREMARSGVGFLVISEGTHVVGVATDRDLVVRGLAARLPADARIDAVMSMDVVAVEADDDVRDVIRSFGHHAVRRLPVVHAGRLVGVVTVDDLWIALTDQIGDLTKGITAQVLFPHGNDEPARPVVRT